MQNRQSRTAYQDATASGATQVDLLQLVYSHLAQDLLRAADAVRKNDVAGRCEASNHALLLLGHLESWVDELNDPTLAESLRAFYRMLVGSILQLQVKPAEEGFRQSGQLVLDTRAAWHAKAESLVMEARGPGTEELAASAGGFSFHA